LSTKIISPATKVEAVTVSAAGFAAVIADGATVPAATAVDMQTETFFEFWAAKICTPS